MKRPRALALMTVLLVCALVAVLTLAVASETTFNLRASTRETQRHQARCAAYAGLQRGVAEVLTDPTSSWSGTLRDVPLGNGARFTVVVVNQFRGGGSVAPDGTNVPAGTVYFQSTGVTGQTSVGASAMGRVTDESLFRAALFANGPISINTVVDSWYWNSLNPYPVPPIPPGDPTPQYTQVRTNSSVANAVSGSYVMGDIIVGPGTDTSAYPTPPSFLNSRDLIVAPMTKPIGNYNGVVGTVDLDVATLGSPATADPGDYRDLLVPDGNVLTLNGGNYYVENVQIGRNAEIRCNGLVYLHFHGDFTVGREALLNELGLPAEFTLRHTGDSGTFTEDGSVRSHFSLAGPHLEVHLSPNSALYGAVVANAIDFGGGNQGPGLADRGVHWHPGLDSGPQVPSGFWVLQGVHYR
ncbi:MAG: hypothetical protein AB1758_32615 [Candidatus Eremiobacterota bacterium]